jgi:hypothetical protein
MVAAHTDLVIQIFGPEDSSEADSRKPADNRFAAELQRCLTPGTEIALVFRGYTALTAILWLSGPLKEGALRAGVRLLGLSATTESSSTDCDRALGSGVESRRQTGDDPRQAVVSADAPHTFYAPQ